MTVMPTGHPLATAPSTMAAFLSNLELTECWVWRGAVNERGYPYISVGPFWTRTHRLAVELFGGQIDDGETVDHLCHNADLSCPGGDTCQHRRCVNPLHLEPVAMAVNKERARRERTRARRTPQPPRTHCSRGHEFTPENTRIDGGYMRCRTCQRATEAARDRKPKKAA